MPTLKQVEAIITAECVIQPSPAFTRQVRNAAEKIVALFDDGGAAVAAAQLEGEVTSTLVDMTIATVLATLIEEEGGGRSNIQFSAMAMDHMMKHYRHTSKMDGLIRTVSVELREDSDLRSEDAWREPSNRHGVMHQDETGGTLMQLPAEPKEHDRPVWAIRWWTDREDTEFANMLDRNDAQKRLADYTFLGRPAPTIENRFCLHTACPSSKCHISEATSE